MADSPLNPGVYHYSAMADRTNHNPPTILRVNDFSTIAQALNHYPLQDPLQDYGFSSDEELNLGLLSDDEAMDFPQEGQIMVHHLGEEPWRLRNIVDLSANPINFSPTTCLSKDTVMKHLKVRSVVKDDEDNICVVCQDCLFHEEDKITTLDCGHEYHTRCITNWLIRKNRCPLCNGTVISVN